MTLLGDPWRIDLGNLIQLGSILVAIGMLINQQRQVAKLLEKLDEKLDKHINDKSVHMDSEDLKERLRDLEGRRTHRSAE